MVTLMVLLLLCLAVGAVYVVLAAPGRAHAGRPSTRGATPVTEVGALAYGVTVGVLGLLASVFLILGGLWLLFVAVISPGLLVFGPTGPAMAVLGAAGLVSLALGLLLARAVRRRLLRL